MTEDEWIKARADRAKPVHNVVTALLPDEAEEAK
jgi:hypothetical protein